jgi:hypothetical protein
MARVSKLTESRLDALYVADGFGGERTMRALVIRELIDEIRELRQSLAHAEAESVDGPAPP